MTWCNKRVFTLGAPCHMKPGHGGDCDHELVPCELCAEATVRGHEWCEECAEAERQIARIVRVPELAVMMMRKLLEQEILSLLNVPILEFDEPTEEQKRNREIVGRVAIRRLHPNGLVCGVQNAADCETCSEVRT